ncbi:MAG: chemotaxis protein CheB [Vicinamibacterales bacterium]
MPSPHEPHPEDPHDDLSDQPASSTNPAPLPYFVVGLGASAGGLEALEQFFDRLPDDLGCAFVVIQHLSPEHKSLMAELLARHTRMPVSRVAEGVRPEPNHVYLNEASHNVVFEGGHLHMVDRPHAINFSIDLFFDSLARAQGPKAIAIVLSGTGSDGMRGIKSIKQAGGLVFVQEAGSARFDGMPRSALATGLADAVVPPGHMPPLIAEALRDPIAFTGRASESTDDGNDTLGQLLDLLGRTTAVDFSHYKRGTVLRRITRRLAATGCQTLTEYLDMARQSPTELDHLRRDLLISVTRFFRDVDVFKALETSILPDLVRAAPAREPFRVWVPACATGEEAYSLAMLLTEVIERDGRPLELRLLATDIDRVALETASAGVYGRGIEADVTPDRLARFFESRDGHYTVRRELRQAVVFAPHDITGDPPFTRISLVSCRNLLIYLDQTLQQRVLAAFRFALRSGGVLVLGPSESVGEAHGAFKPIEQRHRIFECRGDGAVRSDFLTHFSGVKTPRPVISIEDRRPRAVDEATSLLMRTYVPPAIVITEHFRLLHVFGDVGEWLRIPQGEAGISVLPMLSRALGGLLSAAVPRAVRHNEPGVYAATTDEHGPATVTLRVTPLASYLDGARVMLVSFEPLSHSITAGTPVLTVDADDSLHLAELQQELRHSRENLQAMLEEMETSNEELQATNEELTSSNEELHSTNEELQAVNEELQTVNAEYASRIQELAELTNDVDNILRSTDIGTLLLDADLTVRKFTPAATKHIPLLDHDLHRPISHFALKLGGTDFLGDLRTVLDSGQPIERRTSTEGSEHVLIRMTPYMSRGDVPTGVVVSFVDISTITEANARTQKVLDSMPQQVSMIDRNGVIVMVNAAWERFARENGAMPGHVGVGSNYFAVCSEGNLPPESEGHEAREGLKRLIAGEIDRFALEYPCHSALERRWFLMHAVRVDGTSGAVISHIDITERKLAELNLRELASVDPLTGLLNRRGLTEILVSEADRARRNASEVSAILIDCDNFKQINDEHGHAVGDYVLGQLSRRLTEVLRPSDRLARIGGDEFVLVLPDTRVVEAALIADRLRQAAAHMEITVNEARVRVTVSMAVTQVDIDAPRIDDILRNAHTSLSDSKANGKNRVTLARSYRLAGTGRAGDVMALLRSNGLRVFHQPIVRLDTGDLVGHEFLTRGPEGPIAQPQELFRRATEDGLLSTLDLRCLQTCVRAAASYSGWRHVNLYPSTLMETPIEELTMLFGEALEGDGFCVELSEQQLLGAPSALRDAVSRLRKVGLRLSIDDVGFGRTSLEHLVLLEPEVVKIDRRWVAGIGQDKGREQTLRRLIRVAHALKALVIAEGIEQREDVKALLDLGAEFGQGYLFGHPAPAVRPN